VRGVSGVERARNAFLPAAEGGDGRGHAFSEAKLERASQTLIFFVFRENLRNQTENDSSPLSLTLSLSQRAFESSFGFRTRSLQLLPPLIASLRLGSSGNSSTSSWEWLVLAASKKNDVEHQSLDRQSALRPLSPRRFVSAEL